MKKVNKLLVVSALGLAVAACSSDNNGPGADLDAPEISVESQSILADSSANLVMLDISDNRSVNEALALTLTSSDETIIANDNTTLVQDGEDWFISITPESDVVGTSSITVTAEDEAGNLGQTTFSVDVIANVVSDIAVMEDLLMMGEDEEPIAINGIELNNDIDSEEWFDDLFVL